MINYDEARREIYSEMSDWEYLAYVKKDPVALEEMERLKKDLNRLYEEAKKDHWEWETVD